MESIIPKEYIERAKLLNNNQKEYVSWCEYLIKKYPNSGTPKTYANDIIIFLESYNKAIVDITYQDINTFTLTKDGISTQKKFGFALKNFLAFIQKNFYEQFEYKSLFNDISYSNSNIDELKKVELLKIDEIIHLRNQLYISSDFRRLFIFELIYRYGLSLHELEECSENNFSFNTNCLILNTRTITLNDFLTKLCFENPKLLNRHNRSYYQYHIGKLEKYVGHGIRYMDIEATHKEHLIKCPSCGNKVINISDEWILAEREDDVFHQKWLICKSCAFGGGYNE